MPKINTDFPIKGSFRMSEKMQKGIANLGPEASVVIREILSEYIPIKEKMQNPMALPRTINSGNTKLHISVTENNLLCLEINQEKYILDSESTDILLANISLFRSTPSK